MSQKISQLPAVIAANISDADILPLVATNITSKVTVANLRTKLGTQPPTGGRTVTDAFTYLTNNSVYNVKDYGAFGDGVTNDTVAVQAAINAAGAAGSRGEVLFPAGTYMCNTLTLPNTATGVGITLRGFGSYVISGVTPFSVATKIQSRAAEPLFTVVAGGSGHMIRDMHLFGNNLGTYGFFGNALEAFFRMSHVLVTKFTNTAISATMGLNEIMYCYVTDNVNGVDMGTDGRMTGNHIISNSGYGARCRGGTFHSDNEIAFNGGGGIIIDATLGACQNITISGGYIEGNTGWQIKATGTSSGNRDISKLKIHNVYVSWIASTGASGGIWIKNSRTVQLSKLNMIGSAGANTSELQAIVLENVDTSIVMNAIIEDVYRNPIKLINASTVAIAMFMARNYAFVGTASDDAYGVYIDAACGRIKLRGIDLEDTRGGGAFAKGIKNLAAGIEIFSYYAYGTLSDSFGSATLFRYDVATAKFVATDITVTGGVSVAGTLTPSGGMQTARGQITAGGSSTTTMFTLPNVAANQSYIVNVFQSGSGANLAFAVVATYGAGGAVTTTIEPVGNTGTILMTIGISGLNVQLTLGSGFGLTTWDWSYVRIA